MIYHWAFTKGGVGKTSHACNFAVWLHHQGRRVCVVDADKQAHVTKFGVRRRAHEPRLSTLPERALLLKSQTGAAIRQLAREFDDLVVDTGGYDSQEIRSVLTVADLVIIPLAVSEIVLESMDDMDELLGHARGFNPELRARSFVNMASTNWVKASDIAAAASYARAFSWMQPFESTLHQRDAYSVAWGQGRGIMEHTDQKAAAEFEGLALEIAGVR